MPTINKDITICVLLFGDHVDLAQRCLNSIVDNSADFAYVKDIRIGLNRCGASVISCAMAFAEKVKKCAPHVIVSFYKTSDNVFKYPTMRRMFHDKDMPLAKYVMWFDDDSYIQANDFWSKLATALDTAPEAFMLGQTWKINVQGRQAAWFATQDWYDVSKRSSSISFCQGAWWVVPSKLLIELNWPIPELKHCGGDSLLGEVLKHKGIPLKKYDYGVRINADEKGQHSKAVRRGYSENVIGFNYSGKPYDVSHHDFEVFTWRL